MAVTRRASKVASEHVTARLAQEGIPLPTRPSHDVPKVPEDVTTLPDEDLMVLWSRLTSWADFLGTRAAAAFVDEREAESRLKFDEACALVENWGGASGEKVTIAEAKRNSSKAVLDAKQTLVERYAYRKMTETLAGNVERSLVLVSRELTRRTGGASPTRRGQKWQT